MSRLLTTRRSEWLPGVAVLGVSVGVATLLGLALQWRDLFAYAGLAVVVLLLLGQVERLFGRSKGEENTPLKSRGKLRLVRGGKTDYDLAADDSTKNQRYLM